MPKLLKQWRVMSILVSYFTDHSTVMQRLTKVKPSYFHYLRCVIGGFVQQRPNDAEIVYMYWRHHDSSGDTSFPLSSVCHIICDKIYTTGKFIYTNEADFRYDIKWQDTIPCVTLFRHFVLGLELLSGDQSNILRHARTELLNVSLYEDITLAVNLSVANSLCSLFILKSNKHRILWFNYISNDRKLVLLWGHSSYQFMILSGITVVTEVEIYVPYV